MEIYFQGYNYAFYLINFTPRHSNNCARFSNPVHIFSRVS